MSKKSSHSRQLKIVFTDTRLWDQLPEKNRLRCRTLLARLFIEVVHGKETKNRRSGDEREDTTRTP